MSRKRRTKDELMNVSEHLDYEMWMMHEVARGLASNALRPRFVNNALLESFSIHARALLDFLYADSRAFPDDVIAEDFFDSQGEWPVLRPAKSELLEKVHRRVAKEVAHLTYARLDVTPEAKKWYYIDIYNDINRVFQVFLRGVK